MRRAGEKLKTRQEAERRAHAVVGSQCAILKVERRQEKCRAPKLYDLTGLQRDASTRAGLTAEETLNALQTLYEKKLATYPRTESRYIGESDIPETARVLSAIAVPGIVGEAAAAGFDASRSDVARVADDSKVHGHGAILPTALLGAKEMAKLDGAERSVAILVCCRLMAATMDPATKLKAKVEAEICGESTLENYVKRLYYYVDDNRSPAAREVAFWVQAMQEGDVSPAVLGQSFLFSPDRANSYTDGQAFYTMASYALLGTDVTDGNADAYLPYFAEGGAVQADKKRFNLTSRVESFAALGVDVGTMDDRIPLDRTVLAQEVEAARATRSTQSTADEADKATYAPGYILRHPVDTVLLFVRSAVENGDHYIRTLVGGSLSYYTVDLAWGWVAVLYLLLAYAALPVQGAVMKPAGKARGWCCAAAALCCLLAVAGCLLWTPTHYDTLYGLQGAHEKAERHNAAALAALDALGPNADFLRLLAAELLERKK